MALTEYDVTVTMVRRTDPNDPASHEQREFTLTVPAVDEEAAIKSGNDLGHCVNTASGYQWKFGQFPVKAQPSVH